MGAGESYILELSAWFETLTDGEREQVDTIHPATGAWAGWYDPIE